MNSSFYKESEGTQSLIANDINLHESIVHNDLSQHNPHEAFPTYICIDFTVHTAQHAQ